MPQLGDIQRCCDRGLRSRNKSIWLACPDCGKERWVGYQKYQPSSSRCRVCQNKGRIGELREKNALWKGGRYEREDGYIRLRIYPDNFFYSMSNPVKGENCGTILEHRLVVAKALGRCLQIWEIIHHKGDKYPKGSKEDKQDNRYPENLQLVTDDRHNQITLLENKIKRLEKRVTLLKAENILLRGEKCH